MERFVKPINEEGRGGNPRTDFALFVLSSSFHRGGIVNNDFPSIGAIFAHIGL